jgi:hypothetical protein
MKHFAGLLAVLLLFAVPVLHKLIQAVTKKPQRTRLLTAPLP